MRLIICLSFLMFSASVFSQEWVSVAGKGGRLIWKTADGKVNLPESSIEIIQAGWLVTTSTGKKGMINETGKLVIDTTYTSLEKIGDSFIAFSTKPKTLKADSIYKSTKTYFYSSPVVFPDNRFGLMNLKGKVLLKPEYSGFRLLDPEKNGSSMILFDQDVSVERQLTILRKLDAMQSFIPSVIGSKEDYETKLTGIISPSGKILIPAKFAHFYRQSSYLYVGILSFDNRFFTEEGTIPQPNGTYSSGCIVGSYPVSDKAAYSYYHPLIVYNNQLNEITHLRGQKPYYGSAVITGKDHYYYFLKDQLIDSLSIYRKYNVKGSPSTVWKSDPCGYQKYEYEVINANSNFIKWRNDFGSLYSVVSDNGHTLYSREGDTVLFSAENHFYGLPNTNDIHIRTCEGKWGLSDTLGNELLPIVSDSMITHDKNQFCIWQHGTEICFPDNLNIATTKEIRIASSPLFQSGTEFQQFFMKDPETNELIQTENAGFRAFRLNISDLYGHQQLVLVITDSKYSYSFKVPANELLKGFVYDIKLTAHKKNWLFKEYNAQLSDGTTEVITPYYATRSKIN